MTNFQQIKELYAFYYLVLFSYQLFLKEIILWNLDWNLFSMSHLSTLIFNSNNVMLVPKEREELSILLS